MKLNSTDKLGIWIIVVIALLCLLANQCNRPKIKTVLVDSSAVRELTKLNLEADSKIENLQGQLLYLSDEKERLEIRLKTSKVIYQTKYKTLINDSLITDSNCLWTLYSANETLLQYDSLYNLQTKELSGCYEINKELTDQVKFNKEFNEKSGKRISELLRFKHIFWKLYWHR